MVIWRCISPRSCGIALAPALYSQNTVRYSYFLGWELVNYFMWLIENECDLFKFTEALVQVSVLSLSFFWTVLLRIPEFWVAQPWKYELWGVRGPKSLRLSLPTFVVTVSRDLWTLTEQASSFQGNRWWFTVQFLRYVFISLWGERLNKSFNLYTCTLYNISIS